MNSIKTIGLILIIALFVFNVAQAYAKVMIDALTYSKAIHNVSGYLDGSYFLTYGFGVYYE